MTVYIPQYNEISASNMQELEPSAQFSYTEADGFGSTYTYEWPDMKIVIHAMRGEALEQHLRGFIGFIRHCCAGLKIESDKALESRILTTKLVLGFVIEKETEDPAVWEGRVEQMIGTIAGNTKALVLWNMCLLDENSKQLFPPQK